MGKGESVMCYVGGDKRSWRCPGPVDGSGCGCNVFTKTDENRYQCNSCGSRFIGERTTEGSDGR